MNSPQEPVPASFKWIHAAVFFGSVLFMWLAFGPWYGLFQVGWCAFVYLTWPYVVRRFV